jgi:hypothetical protein
MKNLYSLIRPKNNRVKLRSLVKSRNRFTGQDYFILSYENQIIFENQLNNFGIILKEINENLYIHSGEEEGLLKILFNGKIGWVYKYEFDIL